MKRGMERGMKRGIKRGKKEQTYVTATSLGTPVLSGITTRTDAAPKSVKVAKKPL